MFLINLKYILKYIFHGFENKFSIIYIYIILKD